MDVTKLILTRRSGESLWIGDAKVTVKIKGRSVRLEIEAPRAVKVLRDELKARAA